MKARLTKKEINQKKQQAAQYKGISYSAVRDDFTVRLRIGTDLMGKPIYFLPIRRYNDISKAINCLENYKELAAGNVARLKKITFSDVLLFWEDEFDKSLQLAKTSDDENEILLSKARINTIRTYLSSLRFLQKNAPQIFKKELRKFEPDDYKVVYNEIFKARKDIKSTTLTEYFVKAGRAVFNKEFRRVLDKHHIAINRDNFRVDANEDAFIKGQNPLIVKETLLYSFEELHKLYKETLDIRKDYEYQDDRLKLIVLILIGTGCRIAELQAVPAKNVYIHPNLGKLLEIDAQYNHYNQKRAVTKTRQSNRIIPLCNYLYKEIKDFIKKYQIKDDEYLLARSVDEHNFPLSALIIERRIKALEKKAGVKNVQFRNTHSHRRDLISYFQNSFKVSEDIVRFFVGHAKKGSSDPHNMYNIDTVEAKENAEMFRIAQKALISAVIAGLSKEDAKKLYNKYKTKAELEEELKDYKYNSYSNNVQILPMNNLYEDKGGIVQYYEMIIDEMNHSSLKKVAAIHDWYDNVYHNYFEELEEYQSWRAEMLKQFYFGRDGIELRREYGDIKRNKESALKFFTDMYTATVIQPDPDEDALNAYNEMIESEGKPTEKEKRATEILFSDEFLRWYYDNGDLPKEYKTYNTVEIFIEDIKGRYNTELANYYMFNARQTDEFKRLLNLPKNGAKYQK